MRRTAHFFTSRQGSASAMVALCLVVIMVLTALAIDLGMIYLKRSALQTAADVGALAGANTILSEGDDLSKIRSIVKRYAYKNLVEQDVPAVALTDSDIVFLKDGATNNTDPDQIEVTVRRASIRNNAFLLYFGKILGIPSVDITVVARAGLVSTCSSKCIKPFVIPTKFEWDDSAAPGTKFYQNGEMDAESLEEVASINILGYGEDDVGTQIVIKPGDPTLTIVPGQYNLVDLPPTNKASPVTGADAVRENIVACTGSNSLYPVEPGDELQLEPGNSMGPVRQGIKEVMDADPYAYWDTTTNAVEGSSFVDPLDSPRVAILAFYDPKQPPVSGRNTIFVYELGAFFIESLDGQGNVYARFMRTLAVDPANTGGDCMLRISRTMLDSSRE